jgi:apolipoprotein N-acyltransferase
MAMAKDHSRIDLSAKKKLLPTKKVFLACLSGILMTMSFPPLDVSFLAWVALVPLFISLENESSTKAFKLGFISGTVHYLFLIYWIVVVLGRYGNLSIFLSSTLCVLMCFCLALFLALYCSLIVAFRGCRFPALLAGVFWVTLEYLRTEYITEFPWCLLGYTQYENLHLIQISNISGVYGLSFLIVLVNALIYRLVPAFQDEETKKRNGSMRWEMVLTALLIIGTLGYGHHQWIERPDENGSQKAIRVVIVQGNIDQSLKWDPSYQSKTLETYTRLTRESFDFLPELIVWPETSVPFYFQDNTQLSTEVTAMATESGAALIFGSPAYKRIYGDVSYYNRAYLVSPDETLPQHYDKVHLVPFGEYVPFKHLLSFVNRMVPAAGDFAEGEKITPLNHKNLSLGTLICFEAIFPKISRIHTQKGANILINITNDAWFGKTSAPYQHLAMAVYRAVENRRPLIRSANTGFSALIGPHGKIFAQGGLFREETLRGRIPISNTTPTFYTRFGDLFAVSMLIVSMVITASLLWRKSASRPLPKK